MQLQFPKTLWLKVYKCELYGRTECINLCLLLRKDFLQFQITLEAVVTGNLKNCVRQDGSFRSCKLTLGWEDVPMRRWAQLQLFRALACYLREISPGDRHGVEERN